jgi:hypothetical protein
MALEPYQPFSRVNQQNAADLNEIHGQNVFDLMLAAEKIGKQKQAFADTRLVLASEGDKLKQEISLLKLVHDAEWKAITENIHHKINVIMQKALAIAKSYKSQKMSEEEFTIKHQQLNQSGQYREEGKLWYKHHALTSISCPFENIAAHLQYIDEQLLSEAKITSPVVTEKQIVNVSSTTDLIAPSNPREYFLQSSLILAKLEAHNNQMIKENEALQLQKVALKDSHVKLIKQFKTLTLGRIETALIFAKYSRDSTNLEFLKHQETFKNDPCTENWALFGRCHQGYEMAKVALNNIDEIIHNIEQILKE